MEWRRQILFVWWYPKQGRKWSQNLTNDGRPLSAFRALTMTRCFLVSCVARKKTLTLIVKSDGIRPSAVRIIIAPALLRITFASDWHLKELTMMRAKTTSLVRTASRSVAARRQLSSAEPKMHKAKDHWADLKAKRPVDHDDLHVRTTS